MWAALFGALGFSFLQLGFDPPQNVSGAGGWIVSGIVFELMALGGAPEEPVFRDPIVRAKVNEKLVYQGVPGIAYTARPAGEAPPPEPRGRRRRPAPARADGARRRRRDPRRRRDRVKRALSPARPVI